MNHVESICKMLEAEVNVVLHDISIPHLEYRYEHSLSRFFLRREQSVRSKNLM
jgi:hypothetical protein